MMKSETKVRLRAMEPSDAVLLFSWENLPESREYGDAPGPYSLRQLTEYAENYDADIFSARQLRLMIEEIGSGKTVGCVDLFDFDPLNSRAAVGIIVAPEWLRHQVAIRALEALAEFCSNVLSLHQLYATVSSENSASRSLFEKAGFTISGRLKSWIRRRNRYTDAYIYQKFIS